MTRVALPVLALCAALLPACRPAPPADSLPVIITAARFDPVARRCHLTLRPVAGGDALNVQSACYDLRADVLPGIDGLPYLDAAALAPGRRVALVLGSDGRPLQGPGGAVLTLIPDS